MSNKKMNKAMEKNKSEAPQENKIINKKIIKEETAPKKPLAYKKKQLTTDEREILNNLQLVVSIQVEKYIKKEKISFYEFAKRCGLGKTQGYKVKNKETNFKLSTIARIAAFLNKKVSLTFK